MDTARDPSALNNGPAADALPIGGAPEAAHGTPRAGMLADLTRSMNEALLSGDTQAARIAHEAIGKLLGSASTAGASTVVDLATRREKG